MKVWSYAKRERERERRLRQSDNVIDAKGKRGYFEIAMSERESV